MNNVFNAIVAWIFKQRIDQIQSFIDHPHDTQYRTFRSLIKTALGTEWGKEHGYASITSLKQYRDHVPINGYEHFKPYIDRLMKGEKNILWPSKTKWFAKSSGTTSEKSKFIPVSPESLEQTHFAAGRDVLCLYCHNNPGTKIFTGKGLIMGGSSSVNQFDQKANSFYGDVSAVMMQNMPLLGHMITTPNLKTALMEDWEKKLETMVKRTLNRNVTHMAGVPSWTLVLIKKLFAETGKNDLSQIWPAMELYVHGGVSFTPYREQYKSLISSSNMRYLETYNASEGFFGIQDRNDSDEMLLMLDYGIFYEFVPMEEIGKDDPQALTLEEVEAGKNYAIVISSNTGLWRYMIGDTILFTSLAPYRVQVTGRVRHFINAFGEEVIVENADKAIASASHETGARVSDYTVGPIFITGEDRGGHEWLIEFEEEPNDLEDFRDKLDSHLQSINSDYEAKRFKGIALQPPVLHAMEPGTFYNWMKERGKLGGQNKVPRLFNDRKYIDEILEFVAKTA